MKLAFFGTGYVGLVTGTCFADLGNKVICVDINKNKIKNLTKGLIPFYEPGLKELVQRNLKQKRLRFTLDFKGAVEFADVIFICVGTPSKTNGNVDLSQIYSVAEEIGKHMNSYKIIINKSTVPVGTAEKVERIIKSKLKKPISFDVISNPEFLREGAAVKDFQNPDRIIIGTDSEKAKLIMNQLYKPVLRAERTMLFTDTKTSEIIKYASNAMLALRISFVNELSYLCEATGADIKQVATGVGLDNRIGSRFLQAGVGYGGSCFSKDVKGLAQTLEQHGFASNILRAVDYVNERQKKSLIPKLKKFLPNLEGKRITLWGISFKPRTSDIRDAPSLVVMEQLKNEYAVISAYDPEAIPEAKKQVKGVNFIDDAYIALKGSDALIIMTEWDEFREPDFELMKKLMRRKIIIDGRNIYNPDSIRALGFEYAGVGRK
ncbi:MAG: UDP-glucose/GDP-mannose dehydrogenase family protein [Nanoarchaeota archaeon]|nr:UDP-glucose/GDP-mannose dehydrogenase family protein [Nanoarchaeota archaeon]MBU1029980.1 UDP-glucose/GDP-mannose dehydrogenase family protein [Nanoarchaeota archaeon]MBU1849249.1 UDP-glucose/GDP-mannose dehydrogenase family protein [Nanoarchaeota archaeon]